MRNKPTFIDLFAGAGGLSEGFIKSGFEAISHVEIDKNACDTLKTRLSYHYLRSKDNLNLYYSYLKNEINRDKLWENIPQPLLDTVINKEISKKNIGEIFVSIDKLLSGRKVDIIVGGPPCQAYSLIGRSRDNKGMKWDRRNFLFRFYAEFLIKYKPQYFVFENVLGLLSAGSKKYLTEMLELFEKCEYSVDLKVLNSEDYGVLQRRRRVVIMGKKGKKRFRFPELPIVKNNWVIKKDLFYDLPPIKVTQELDITNYTRPINNYLDEFEIRNGLDFVTQHITRKHNDRDLEIYAIALTKWLNEKVRLKYNDLPARLRTHKNIVAFLDRYKVVDPQGHSHTMVAHIAKDGHYYIYPDLNQIRSISVREAARIQSFPDDYYFEGGRTSAFKQIGNAVPPLMAQSIAKHIKALI